MDIPTPVHLLDLGPKEFKKFMDSFDHVFSDCDGVIWGTEPFSRVGEFFDLMEKHGKTVNFVSNNSVRGQKNYEHMFKLAKIENGYERLTVPSIAIAEYLKEQNLKKAVYCVSSTVTTNLLESYGFKCKTGPDLSAEYYEDYIAYIEDDPEIGAVVFDFDVRINLAKIHKASTYLINPEVLFVCGASDKRIHFKKGIHALGCAVFTDIVAEESGRKPLVLSKPSREFAEFAMKRAGVNDPKRVLFIGDTIEQDIGLGKTTGFTTLMILTNVPKEVMMNHETIRPNYYAESLASIVPQLQKYEN